MKFCDIPSHDIIKQRLVAMVDNDRIPHALLLEGPSGIGKFAIARALAQYIHCENRNNGDSCDCCPSCMQHKSFNHIDTHFVFPVVKKSSPKRSFSDDYIVEWRDFLANSAYMDFEEWLDMMNAGNSQPAVYVEESEDLIRKLNYTSHNAKYKIVLIWLPERMRDETANKLLKLIEEPYGDTLFILVSNNSKGILPTIYSRTQRVEMKRLSDGIIADRLVADMSLEYADAMSIAHNASGNMNVAYKSVKLTKENNRFLDLFKDLMRLAYQRKVKELKQWSIDVAAMGREQEMRFLEYCQRLIRENFIYNMHIPELNYLSREEESFSVNFARFVNERNVIKITEEFNRAVIDIAGNANAKIVLFDMCIKIILLLKN